MTRFRRTLVAILSSLAAVLVLASAASAESWTAGWAGYSPGGTLRAETSTLSLDLAATGDGRWTANGLATVRDHSSDGWCGRVWVYLYAGSAQLYSWSHNECDAVWVTARFSATLATRPTQAIRYIGLANGKRVNGGVITIAPLPTPPPPAPAAPVPTPAPPPPASPPAPAPSPVTLVPKGCKPSGQPIVARIVRKPRAGRRALHVVSAVFWMKPGQAPRTAHHRPFRVTLANTLPAGSRARIYARIRYRLPGQRRVHRLKTARTIHVCSPG